MRHRYWLILLLCALFLFSMLACEVSGRVVLPDVAPPHAPPGAHPPQPNPPGPNPRFGWGKRQR